MREDLRPEQTPSSPWRRLIRLAVQWAALFGLWVAFSGDISLEFLAWGGLAAAVAIAFSELLFRGTQEHVFPSVPSRFAWYLRTAVRFIVYVPWLTYQVTVASLHVAYLVVHPRIPIEPALVEFETSLLSEPAHVLLAQSISLTPGTITVDAFEGTLLVHSLSRVTRQGLEQGGIQRRVAGVFDEPAAERVELTEVLRPGQVPL